MDNKNGGSVDRFAEKICTRLIDISQFGDSLGVRSNNLRYKIIGYKRNTERYSDSYNCSSTLWELVRLSESIVEWLFEEMRTGSQPYDETEEYPRYQGTAWLMTLCEEIFNGITKDEDDIAFKFEAIIQTIDKVYRILELWEKKINDFSNLTQRLINAPSPKYIERIDDDAMEELRGLGDVFS